MKSNCHIRLSRNVLVFVLGLIAITCAIAIFSALAASKPPAGSTETNHAPSPLVSGAERLEAEVITILPSGFEPTEITRPAGKFLLAVENRSGLKSVEFQLSAQTGSRIFQVNRSWERSDWNDVVNPPPGKYILSEASHPTWQCVITITP